MFLLGIISEATGIGAIVLNELEINIRDARIIVEKIIGNPVITTTATAD